MEYTAQGDAVVTDNILEVDDLLETQKPFNASDLAGYSVLDSASGREIIFDFNTVKSVGTGIFFQYLCKLLVIHPFK